MEYHDEIQYAAKVGNLDIIKSIHSKGAKLTDNMLIWAAEYGHLEAVEWLYLNKVKIKENAIYYASKNGHLEVVKWLFEHGAAIKYVLMDLEQVEGRRLQEYYLDKRSGNTCLKGRSRYGKVTCSIMDAAAENGHLELVKWLYNKGGVTSSNALQCATKSGHLDVVEYLGSLDAEIVAERAERHAEEVAEYFRTVEEARIANGARIAVKNAAKVAVVADSALISICVIM